MWQNVKNLSDTKKSGTPQMISHDNKIITSPKVIANIANKFYIDKIINLRNKFTNLTFDPLTFVKNLLPRNRNEFTIPILKIEDTTKLIKKANNSWTIGHDDISMNVLHIYIIL